MLFSGANTTDLLWAYDADLVLTTPNTLSIKRYPIDAVQLVNYTIFGSADGSATKVTDIFDSNLMRTSRDPLTVIRTGYAAIAVGNYALFCGGADNDDHVYDTVDVYTIA